MARPREHQPVAEPVVGLAAALGRDQHPGLDEVARPGTPLDEGGLQPLAIVGGIAEAEPLPLIFGQAALFQIFARRLSGRTAQIGGEPFLGQVHPVGQALLLRLAFSGLRILGRQGHARLPRQPLHGLDEGQPLRLLQEGDDVAMLPGREIVEEALVVVDEEGRRLLP